MAKIIRMILPYFIVLSLVSNSFAGSVAGFGGALEFTQIANNIQLMQQYVQQALQVQNQIQQIANQLSMYQNMITNTQNFISNPFQSVTQTLAQLQQAINQASNISYTVGSIDTYFQQLNPNYAQMFQNNTYEQQQQTWRNEVDEYCKAALKTAGHNISNLQTEAQVLQTLNQASQSAAGQKAAVQVGNEIALQMASKIGELKALVAAQTQAQTIYIAEKQAKEKADEEYGKYLFNNTNKVDLNNNQPLIFQ